MLHANKFYFISNFGSQAVAKVSSTISNKHCSLPLLNKVYTNEHAFIIKFYCNKKSKAGANLNKKLFGKLKIVLHKSWLLLIRDWIYLPI
jgi:hypothetical protein